MWIGAGSAGGRDRDHRGRLLDRPAACRRGVRQAEREPDHDPQGTHPRELDERIVDEHGQCRFRRARRKAAAWTVLGDTRVPRTACHRCHVSRSGER